MIMIQTKNVMYRDLNNLYGWASYQLMVSNEEKTSTDLMKNSKKIMIKTVTNHISAKLVFSIPRSYLSYPHYMLFKPEWMKIEKYETPVPKLYNKTYFLIRNKALKESMNHGTNSTYVNRNDSSSWAKAIWRLIYETESNDLEKTFFKLINNIVFGMNMKNMKNT